MTSLKRPRSDDNSTSNKIACNSKQRAIRSLSHRPFSLFGAATDDHFDASCPDFDLYLSMLLADIRPLFAQFKQRTGIFVRIDTEKEFEARLACIDSLFQNRDESDECVLFPSPSNIFAVLIGRNYDFPPCVLTAKYAIEILRTTSRYGFDLRKLVHLVGLFIVDKWNLKNSVFEKCFGREFRMDEGDSLRRALVKTFVPFHTLGTMFVDSKHVASKTIGRLDFDNCCVCMEDMFIFAKPRQLLRQCWRCYGVVHDCCTPYNGLCPFCRNPYKDIDCDTIDLTTDTD